MSAEKTPPSFGQRMLSFIRFVVRLLFVLILAIGLGAGIYYTAVTGIPWLYQRYVQPVEDHSLRLDDLEARQAQEAEVLGTRIESLQERLTALEVLHDSDKETISNLESRLAAAESTQGTQAAAIASLAPLPSALADTQADLAALQAALDDLAATVEVYDQRIISLGEGDQEESALLIHLKAELQLLRGMEFLTRARLFLSQGNLAQAEANIGAGLEALTTLEAEAPDYQKTALEQINVYLAEALLALPVSPVGAADQLEGAWALLIDGLPSESDAGATPAPDE